MKVNVAIDSLAAKYWKIDSLVSRNPRKLGKKKGLLVELTAYENDSDKRAPKKIRVIARLRKS